MPGDFVHLPPGGVNGIRNESGEEASILVLFAPREYVETPFAQGTKAVTEQEKQAFFGRHDAYWL